MLNDTTPCRNDFIVHFTKNEILMTKEYLSKFDPNQKAICFGDTKIAEKILETTDVAQIKALGRKVPNYNETIWNGKRQILVYNGLCAKFQNPELKAKLKATGDAVLAECAVRDCIWGIGLSMTDSKRLEMDKWRGQNLLGFALMIVRDAL